MSRKLPIGIQSFEKLRQGGYVYVDKTVYLHKLVKEGVPVFLSRPRRFGKSLFVSTLRAYFEGKRELFEGLDIERLEDGTPESWTPRPVFCLDFNGADYTRRGGLEDKLNAMLCAFEDRWGSNHPRIDFGPRFQRLLELAHEASGYRVVVLVDEYDKPLLDTMHDATLEEANRSTLKGFFSALKVADEHLHFVFITGVTKFSKVSIFSDLNQLRDISLVREFGGICGITQDELEANFPSEISHLAQALDLSRTDCAMELASTYDGYRFHQAGPNVYNPFSLLNAFANGDLGSYWYSTGTPTFLVKRLRKSRFDPRSLTNDSIYANAARLSDYRADDPDPVPLMYQAGYLTIRAYDMRRRRYTLAVPNNEVQYGLLENLLPLYAPSTLEGTGADVYTLDEYLETGNLDGVRDVITTLFASIPYTREDDPFENYFQTVLWLTFTLLGRFVRCEMHTAHGRIDCVVQTDAHVYLFEFKRDGTAVEALAQIDKKGYAAPFAADQRELHRIGCAFDSTTRQLCDWDAR